MLNIIDYPLVSSDLVSYFTLYYDVVDVPMISRFIRVYDAHIMGFWFSLPRLDTFRTTCAQSHNIYICI